jgi:hypothetical protein
VGIPVANQDLTFSLVKAPLGTALVSTTATSNALGQVVAKVTSGPSIGAFNVKVTLASPALSTVSPTIGVRGAKPSNHGFTIYCENVNLGVNHVIQKPDSVDLKCFLGLSDRFNNPVGTGTSVYFKSEAGTITNEVSTIAFDPEGTNDNEGRGEVLFRTRAGGPLFPVETSPLAAAPSQWPYARVAEPSYTDGALTKNPRDMFVTILAYTQGEEYFWDEDSDGVHDAAERFIDQGEPFVDSDDDGVHDPDELFIDSDQDGVYDNANGTWDADTTIWTEQRVVYTGPAAKLAVTTPYQSAASSGPCTNGVPLGGSDSFEFLIADEFLNFPALGTTLSVENKVGKGEANLVGTPSTLLESYGPELERILVDSATDTACVHGVAKCKWKTIFYDQWQHHGFVKFTGAALNDTSGCKAGTVDVSITTKGVVATMGVSTAAQ